MRPSSHRSIALLAIPVLAVAAIASTTGTADAADGAFSLSTPYPTVETRPGTTIKADIDVAATAVDPVELAIGGVPDGWDVILRGGGFVVHAVTASPDSTASAQLEVTVPPDAAPGQYPLTVTGTDPSGATSTMTMTLDVAEEVSNGISLKTDFPSLTGEPGNDFSYNLTITNDTPEEQTFTFDPSGPQGWTTTASPTAQSRAETVTIEAGGTGSVKVTATPPDSADEGTYPIDVTVTSANGATGSIQLSAEVTGTPKLSLATADQRLDVSGQANAEHRIPLIVANTGTAALEEVKLAGTAPSGWDVSFDPKTVPNVQPGETAQVTAIVSPSADAVAGDYAMTIRASAGSESSSIDLRYGLKGSRTLGVIAVAVIVAAVGTLVGVFVKFGRR